MPLQYDYVCLAIVPDARIRHETGMNVPVLLAFSRIIAYIMKDDGARQAMGTLLDAH